MDFEFEGNPEILEVHIFRAKEYVGEPTESEEMIPKWFHRDEIPFSKSLSTISWYPVYKPLFLGEKQVGALDIMNYV